MKVHRAEVLRVLRNAGFPHIANELALELPESIERDDLRPFAERYGVNLEVLVDRMGGSP